MRGTILESTETDMSRLGRCVGWLKTTAHHAPSLPRFWKWHFVNTLMLVLPDDELSAVLRGSIIRLAGANVAEGAMVRQGVRFRDFNVTVGKSASIGYHCKLDTDRSAGITIGDYAVLSPQVTIVTATHSLDGVRARIGPVEWLPVTIGEGAWLGLGCTILAGVTIGARSVVAAGAVVTKDVPDNTLVAGVPAKIVKELDPQTSPADAAAEQS
jgi:maltose O-acetyltransferase